MGRHTLYLTLSDGSLLMQTGVRFFYVFPSGNVWVTQGAHANRVSGVVSLRCHTTGGPK